MLPNFILAGAPRCGTTWLYDCFREHPQIFVPEVKEVRFFDLNYAKGLDWYYSFFEKSRGEPALGELSPTYMYHSEVPRRIQEWNREVKLIFSLRPPLDRAYSAYCNALFEGTVSDDVNRLLSPDSYWAETSLYYKHISRFLEFFPLSQVKILIFDDLKNNPGDFLRDIFTYLEVEQKFLPKMLNSRSNIRKPLQKNLGWKNTIVRMKNSLRQKSRLFGKVIEVMRRTGVGDFIFRLNKGEEYPVLAPESRRKLLEFFKPDVMNLSSLINRDLSAWLK